MSKNDKIMQDVLMVIAVFGSISYAIVSIVRSFSEHTLRKKIIDKAGDLDKLGPEFSESLKSIGSNVEQNRYPSLKWGLLFLFAGIGLILIEFFGYNYNSTLPFGILSACVAVGFLLYYFILKNESKRS